MLFFYLKSDFQGINKEFGTIKSLYFIDYLFLLGIFKEF